MGDSGQIETLSGERLSGQEYMLESTPALNDHLTFPDVAQVVRRSHLQPSLRWIGAIAP